MRRSAQSQSKCLSTAPEISLARGAPSRLPLEEEAYREPFRTTARLPTTFCSNASDAGNRPSRLQSFWPGHWLYVLGFVALYPLAQASVAKSVAEGNDPALLEFVGP